MINNIYLLIVIYDRYNGSYSGRKYVAFNLESPDIPKEIFGDDSTVIKFWKHCKIIVGVEGSSDSAIKDLIKNLRKKINNYYNVLD